jgi:lysophospholipase L1-like esterase
MATYRDQLSGLEQALPLYLDQVRDLKAIASARQIKVLYALQPELVVENPSHLTTKEVQIQEAAFRHHRDFGTLSWRFLSSRMTTSLTNLSDDQFQFVNLVTIAAYETQDVYTDYCHLTPKGNRVIAEKLYPWVVDLIGVEHLGPNDTINRDSRE